MWAHETLSWKWREGQCWRLAYLMGWESCGWEQIAPDRGEEKTKEKKYRYYMTEGEVRG